MVPAWVFKSNATRHCRVAMHPRLSSVETWMPGTSPGMTSSTKDEITQELQPFGLVVQGKCDELSSGVSRRRSGVDAAPHHQRRLRAHPRNGLSVPHLYHQHYRIDGDGSDRALPPVQGRGIPALAPVPEDRRSPRLHHILAILPRV